ncbi:hypothetical protein D1BOALGB6SA_5866 [Olavius sp. associated proteobacterium Delta 1]|nr:hypothetical protein D1BOALGB6SA_5866 [Olavius sp. associated proteobacterium Delta 1]
MGIIGLELNDSGILAAGGSPPILIDLDGQVQESPGFALPQKKGLLVGETAASKAHLFPRQILNHFWDQLNTEPLEQTGKHFPLNHAEIAFRHLSLIWQQLQSHGDEIVMAVPSFYDREHLGLILGICQELGMPVRGFVPLALAASSHVGPDKMLLYLDIHLHRIEVIYLEQGEHLSLRDSATTVEKGLLHLYRKLVDMIAQEFVRTTRFDPFHQAASEQELYDRLPGILSHFQHNSSMVFEITGGFAPYSITLERDSITRISEPVYREVLRLIKRMQNKRGRGRTSLALQLSQRLARLPGCKEMLATLKDVQIIELDRGAAAMGVPQIWNQLAAHDNNGGISFFTSRPWQDQQQTDDHRTPAATAAQASPTHLLYHSIAYPITEKPLTIGSAHDGRQNDITISGAAGGVSPKHCTLELKRGEILLKDISEEGTFVDEQQVKGSITLKVGQVIRVGNSGEKLQMIACINSSTAK